MKHLKPNGDERMQNKMIPLTVANTLDQSNKQRVEMNGSQTIKEQIRSNKLTQQGEFDVFDKLGIVISDRTVETLRDETVYVGPPKIIGGAGIPRERLKELKIEYPSIRNVKQHTTRNAVEMISVRFPSAGKTKSGFWSIVIHCPNAASGLMHAYVLDTNVITGRVSVSLYDNPPSAGYCRGAQSTIPGSKRKAKWVCHGDYLSMISSVAGRDPVKRVGAYINHIQNLLNA